MSSESHTNEQLLDLARGGDRGAFGELTRRYHSYLSAVATRTLGKPADCSSVVQEGVTKALANFEKFRGTTPQELLGWFAAIVANEARDRNGKGFLAPISTEEGGSVQIEGSVSTPSASLSRREQAAKLLAAAGRLSDDYRQVIDLRYFQGLSYEDIAARMNRSNAAVRKLTERALKELRVEMGDDL